MLLNVGATRLRTGIYDKKNPHAEVKVSFKLQQFAFALNKDCSQLID